MMSLCKKEITPHGMVNGLRIATEKRARQAQLVNSSYRLRSVEKGFGD